MKGGRRGRKGERVCERGGWGMKGGRRGGERT